MSADWYLQQFVAVVADVLPVVVPLDLVLSLPTEGKDRRPHAVREEGVVFLAVDEGESIAACPAGEELEVEPVAVSLGVDIVLQNEVELARPLVFHPLHHVHQIAALKSRVELALIRHALQVELILPQ